MKNKNDRKNQMLSELNSFMSRFGVDEITFGKTHSVKQSKGKLAKEVIHKNVKQ